MKLMMKRSYLKNKKSIYINFKGRWKNMREKAGVFIFSLAAAFILLVTVNLTVFAKDYTRGYTDVVPKTKEKDVDFMKGDYSYHFFQGNLEVKDSDGKLIFEAKGSEDKYIGAVLAGETDFYYAKGTDSKLYRFDFETGKSKKLATTGEPGFYFGIDEKTFFAGNDLYFRVGSGEGLALGKINLKNHKIKMLGNECGFAVYKNKLYADKYDFESGKVTVYSYKMDMTGKKKVCGFKAKRAETVQYLGLYKVDSKYVYYTEIGNKGELWKKFKYR